MLLTNKHIKQFAFFYLFCFLLNYTWFVTNGLLFSSLQPVFFVNKLDITRNIIFLSNLQHTVLESRLLQWGLDIAYLLLPVLLVLFTIRDIKGKTTVAICTSLFCLLYGILFSGVSYISIEGYIGWMLIPLIFSGKGVKSFYYNLHCVRLIFILIFFSAAIWKLRAGGFFNVEQMAGILLQQHNSYLVSNNDNWFTRFTYYLVQHKTLAYVLYLLATIGEAVFVTGLFTRKFDKYLILVFCVFVVFDLFLMGINYFGWTVFMGCFYFSRFSLQADN